MPHDRPSPTPTTHDRTSNRGGPLQMPSVRETLTRTANRCVYPSAGAVAANPNVAAAVANQSAHQTAAIRSANQSAREAAAIRIRFANQTAREAAAIRSANQTAREAAAIRRSANQSAHVMRRIFRPTPHVGSAIRRAGEAAPSCGSRACRHSVVLLQRQVVCPTGRHPITTARNRHQRVCTKRACREAHLLTRRRREIPTASTCAEYPITPRNAKSPRHLCGEGFVKVGLGG
jgi:hypothetical protein